MNGQVVPAFTLIVVFEIKAQDARDVFWQMYILFALHIG